MEKAKQFLSPQSMLTPGVAGAIVMMISNTITMQFTLDKPWSAGISILASFIIGLLVWASEVTPYWKRFVYYIVNSFIIFNVAVGANTLGQNSGGLASIASAITPTAYAEPASGWCCLNNRVNQSPQAECTKWGGKYFSTQKQAQQACQTTETIKEKTKKEERKFFKPWF